MKRIAFPSLAAASILLGASLVCSTTRPHYGGALRVQMHARVASLDPRDWPADPVLAAATDRVASLISERLVQLDESGQPQPALATAWQHDAGFRRWEFRLRNGVRFHDRTPLTPVAVVAAWRRIQGKDWLASVSGEWLVIQSERPMPGLLAELGRGRYLVAQVSGDGSVVGTGPFRVAEWQPRRRLVLAANEDYWGGRPFVDTIEISLDRSPREQWVDLELGKADLVELWPDQARRFSPSGARTWSSAPVELLAVVFDLRQPAVQDARLRQAIAVSIDRAAIVNVLLQKHGEAAGSLLPQWLSGYAFLFSTAHNPERARQLQSELQPAAPPAAGTLAMRNDSTDPLAKAVAERIAVNAREAGIKMQLSGSSREPTNRVAPSDAAVVRLRFASTEPRWALAELAASLELAGEVHVAEGTLEELYAAERALLETYRVIPLVHLPEMYGLSPRVKNWTPPRRGGWRLENVWLERSSGTATGERKP